MLKGKLSIAYKGFIVLAAAFLAVGYIGAFVDHKLKKGESKQS